MNFKFLARRATPLLVTKYRLVDNRTRYGAAVGALLPAVGCCGSYQNKSFIVNLSTQAKVGFVIGGAYDNILRCALI